jgi:NitT/TauT family transport system ATP-binding protein
MQQRVSICRALIHNPSVLLMDESVLLMDEPSAALDAMTREELGFELLRIWDTDKKTVIFVTHNITEAILLADRVVAMSPHLNIQGYLGYKSTGKTAKYTELAPKPVPGLF